MENFGNYERMKETLLNELDNITDEKKIIFDQIRNLEKEEHFIRCNILFFESYVNFLKHNSNPEISMDDFLKYIPYEEIKTNKNSNIRTSKIKKDLIEENLKAFDEGSNYKYEHIKTVCRKVKSKQLKKEKEIEEINEQDSNAQCLENDKLNFNIEDINKKNYQDENYFVSLIKRNFDN